MECIQGVYVIGSISWLGAATSVLAFVLLGIISVALHELGHAIPGWIMGGTARPNGFGGGLFTLFYGVRKTEGEWTFYRNMMPHVDFDGYEQLSKTKRRLLIIGGPLANLAIGVIGLALIDRDMSLDPATAFVNFQAAFQAWGHGCDAYMLEGQQKALSELLFLHAYLFFALNVFLGIGNLIPFHKMTDGMRLIKP